MVLDPDSCWLANVSVQGCRGDGVKGKWMGILEVGSGHFWTGRVDDLGPGEGGISSGSATRPLGFVSTK